MYLADESPCRFWLFSRDYRYKSVTTQIPRDA